MIKVTDVAIETFNLTKVYGKKIHALNELNLKVARGETFSLLGPNGAGKTTTVRLLNAIIRPTSGTATVAGYDILREPEKVKYVTGLLPEAAGVYEKLTAREFLTFIGRLYDVPKDALKARVDDLLGLFDLSDRGDDLLESYSRGMKQKVLIASALVHDPELIFCDEPTNGLDPTGREEMLNLIKDLSRNGKNIVFSSHILPDVEEICDKTLILSNGSLIKFGSLEELLNKQKEVYLIKVDKKTVFRDLQLKEGFNVKEREDILAVHGTSNIPQKIISLAAKYDFQLRLLTKEQYSLEDFYLDIMR